MSLKTAKEYQFTVLGMNCAGCVKSVENALKAVAGVEKASVNFSDNSAVVVGESDLNQLIKAVAGAGFEIVLRNDIPDPLETEELDHKHYLSLLKKSLIATMVGLPIMLAGHFGVLPELTNTKTWLIIALFVLMAMIYSGKHYYLGAYRSLLLWQINMDTLIALGTGSAWIYSLVIVLFPQTFTSLAPFAYFEAAIIIIAFINLGSALEVKARGKTSAAIRELTGLQAKNAQVVRNGKDYEVPIKDIVVGDTIRVRPGEKIAVDGVIIEGTASIDEAMISGEPIPVNKKVGSKVISGTINQHGSFLFSATKVGADTFLAQIIKSVRRAQASKPNIAKLADQIASVFVPIVLIISLITFIIWLVFGPAPQFSYAFICSVTVLVIACPCALGLATPLSIMVAVGKAAKSGILIRGGNALQKASKIDIILLDKTGTVTSGLPAVKTIIGNKGFSKERVLQYAASIESGSEHCLAQAIIKANESSLPLFKVEDFKAIVGYGVRGRIGQDEVLLGNMELMHKNNIIIEELHKEINDLLSQGQTLMFLAINKQLVGLISVIDPIKQDSSKAIAQIKQLGIKVMMVTGDNPQTANQIAKQCGINQVQAQALPLDKIELVKKLQNDGQVVAMVGDGINDAPALAQADVGIAIGTGTDVALASSDIVLIQGSLMKVLTAVELSKATLLNIKQNLIGAFFYNSIGIPIAAGLLFPMFGILLNPMLAGFAMALSSLTVVSNANRLRWKNLDKHIV